MTIPIHGSQLAGAFSDNGRLLAMQPPSGNGPLVVFDTETGALKVIPGTALRFAEAERFSWQDGGHRLIVLAAPGDSSSRTTQIAYWDPGDTRLRVATIHTPVPDGGVVTAWPPQ
jgi:hypothetical protein